MSELTSFGKLLRSCRALHNGGVIGPDFLSIKHMADFCGMGTAELSGLEHGRAEPTRDQIDAIAECLMKAEKGTLASNRERMASFFPPLPTADEI